MRLELLWLSVIVGSTPNYKRTYWWAVRGLLNETNICLLQAVGKVSIFSKVVAPHGLISSAYNVLLTSPTQVCPAMLTFCFSHDNDYSVAISSFIDHSCVVSYFLHVNHEKFRLLAFDATAISSTHKNKSKTKRQLLLVTWHSQR